jgi:peptidoglycan/LPS O-acetylase OafA/YrhL
MAAVEGYLGLVRLGSWTRSPWLAGLWVVLAKACEWWFMPLSPLFYGLLFFTVVNACVHRERSGNWPSSAISEWLRRVGVFSYSLYLCHPVVQNVMAHVFRSYGPVQHDSPVVRMAVAVVEFLLMLVASYGVGRVFYRLVEVHFVPKASGKSQRRAAVRTSGEMPA